MDAQIERAAEAIARADYLCVTTGAGMSADSGLPVFAALSNHPAMQQRGLTYDQIASPDRLVKDPALFYGFWLSCRQRYQSTAPHAGYSAVARWINQLNSRDNTAPGAASRAFVVTSNVDGFMQRAGVPDGVVAQIHGDCVGRWQCGGEPNREPPHFPLFTRDGCGALFEPALDEISVDADALAAAPRAGTGWPQCPRCGGAARPHVYLFGDGSRFRNDPAVTKQEAWAAWRERVLAALRAEVPTRIANPPPG